MKIKNIIFKILFLLLFLFSFSLYSCNYNINDTPSNKEEENSNNENQENDNKDDEDNESLLGDIIIYDDYAVNNKLNITIYEDKVYNQKEEVALYLVSFKKLPSNYYNRNDYNNLKNNWTTTNLISCTGGKFYNREERLPKNDNYIECDIDSNKYSRGAYRIVFNEDYNQIYYTHDHYDTFVRLYDSYNYDGITTYA